MESLLHIITDYWPYLLGLFFLAVTAINARTWFVNRRTES
jgi:hypothetical protein